MTYEGWWNAVDSTGWTGWAKAVDEDWLRERYDDGMNPDDVLSTWVDMQREDERWERADAWYDARCDRIAARG